MKKKLKYAIVAVVAFTLGLTSCNKKDDPAPAGENALLNISIAVPADMKASGASTPEDVINNFTVFVTDKSTKNIAWSKYSSTSSDLVINVSTNAEHVYVVANAADLTGSVKTLDRLNDLVAELGNVNPQSTAAHRWATGNTTVPLTFTRTGNDFTTSAEITVTFIAARITVKIANNMANQGGSGALALTNIAVLNARGQSRLFPPAGSSSLIPPSYVAGNNRNFYQGLANSNFTYYPPATDFTMATEILSDVLTVSVQPANEVIYYYYVFENNAVAPENYPTIVTLIGDYNGNKRYWPVHLAPYEQLTGTDPITDAGIIRGKSYNITIILKGDATTGGGGTSDPTLPIASADISISVLLKPWYPVVLGKEFE